MSGARHIVVSRDYRPTPDACARALELLLKKSVSKEAAHPAASKDAKEIKSVRARTIIQE
jgi:hypothetical protein